MKFQQSQILYGLSFVIYDKNLYFAVRILNTDYYRNRKKLYAYFYIFQSISKFDLA